MKNKKINKIVSIILSVSILTTVCSTTTFAASRKQIQDTNIKTEVNAYSEYINWEGVSSVSEFKDQKGNFCFAYVSGKKIIVVKTKNGKVINTIKLAKKYPLFGGVACDSKGNFYLASGKDNEGNKEINTVFISKYDKEGKHIKTVGDDGSSSLSSGSSFLTKKPFDAGNCDIEVNGNLVTVNYAREMYSGHQSNSVFTVDSTTMTKVDMGRIYNSHSFAQRAIAYKDGFVYASEGDCFPRAFTISTSLKSNENVIENDVFHFWVKKGTYSNWDMGTLNYNYAHMGDLAVVGSNKVAFLATSVKSLNSNANKENEQLFIQIFDPEADLSNASSYVTKGTRSGLSGPDGNVKVTDYGVKFLTNSNAYYIDHPQMVSNGKNKLIVLYEKYNKKTGSYNGSYFQVLNSKGEVIKKETLYSKNIKLNPCETPIYTDGKVNWVTNNDKGYISICSLKIK